MTTGTAAPGAGELEPELSAFSLDAQLRYTHFNDVHAEIMRALYGAEIAVGDRIEDHMKVAIDRETALANLRRALGGERVVASAFSGDGASRRYFDVTHTPVRDAGGVVVGVDVCAYDASDRELIERELEEERQRYRSLVDSSADAILSWQTDGTVVTANPAAERMFGLPVAELRQRGRAGIVDPTDPRASEIVIEREPTGDFNTEVRFLRGDGTAFEAEATGAVFVDPSGVPSESIVIRDISERKVAQEALAASELRYRELFRHSVLGITVHEVVLDDAGQPVDYVFLEVNPAFEALSGLRAADVVGRRATDVIPSIEETELIETYGKVVASGEPATFELHVAPLDREFAVIAYAVGERSFVTIFEDVTERRRTDRALAESEERYRMLAENATDAVFRSSNEGIVEWVSPSVAGIVGWSPGELQGQAFGEFVHPDDRSVLIEAQDRVLRGGTARYEVRVRCRDGRHRWISITLRPIVGEDGTIVGRVAGWRDIDSEVAARAALAESEKLFRTVADFTYDWEWWRAPDGRLLYVSPSSERVTGHSAEEFIADSDLLLRITHPDDRRRMLDHYVDWRPHDHGDAGHDLEFRIRTADGRERWIGHRCTRVISPDGTDLGVRASNRDITDRKAAEQELRDREARLRARTEELDALLEVSRRITSSIDFDEVLAHAAKAAGETLDSPRCEVWEYLQETEVFQCRYLWEREPQPGLFEDTVGRTYDLAGHREAIDALARGEPELDRRSDPELSEEDRRLMDERGETAWLSVPLVSKRGLLGILNLSETEREREFTEQERRLVSAIAEQAAVAMENALLLREQAARNRWLHALVAAIKDAASRLDMEELLVGIARNAADSVGAAEAVIYEFDPERDVLIARSLYGSGRRWQSDEPGREFAISDTPSDLAILANDHVVVETLSDPLLPQDVRDLMQELGEKTLVNVPFRYGGEPLGLLVLVATEEERVFGDEELEYLRAFGEQAALAVHNAHLYAAAQQAREDLARLNIELERRVEQRAAELRAVNEEMEAFAYSVSHDLRAPLRAIDGFSLVLMEDEADALSAVGRGNLARVRGAAQRMGQLIDALLALSRLGRREIECAPVELSRLATQVLERLSERDPSRRVAWEVAPGCRVVSDPELLGVVLDNLLGNAWKFTSESADAHIEFGARMVDGEVAYFVRDDGAGFDPAYADKLFQPFQRLHTDEQFAGTGIGLATVDRVVTRLGGRCWAEGAVGAGATFFFTLGARAATGPGAADHEEGHPAPGSPQTA